MSTQVKAFALLFTVLLAVDALAYRGAYRIWIGGGIISTFSSAHGLGPGRNWSAPKPSRND
jgi:hypothetical protein